MSEHKKRAELRAESNDPINFTCGICHHVVRFKKGYVWSYCESLKDDTVEDTVDEEEEVV